jgi:quercetin dioxygenase-like cupin family protein
MTEQFQGRLRVHPQERFALEEQRIDIWEAAKRLRAEASAVPRGHKEVVLYRHGPATIALFHFEAGAGLKSHRAKGVVSVQPLEGRIVVTTPRGKQELSPGALLVLAPDVPHDVQAVDESVVLVSICSE